MRAWQANYRITRGRRPPGDPERSPDRDRASRVTRSGRLSLLALVLVLLAGPLVADAQQPGTVYRIGYLRYLACTEPAFFTDLRQGLRELGYAEGHNLVIDCRAAPGRADKIPDHAAELVRLSVDVIVAEGTTAALAAKQATRTVPIVMVNIGDPVASGLVSSLGRPGGNITGSTMLAPEIVRKTLQLLKEAAPAVSRVTVLIDPTNPGQTLPDQQMAAAAEILGVRPQRVKIQTSADLDHAFTAVLRQRAQALSSTRYRSRLSTFRGSWGLRSRTGCRPQHGTRPSAERA